ncbi:MAG: M3 family metallopeptidase [Planctomycetes bacterium]|nr:M3 family metallopeptidase [Planctomycetota bacterium]
MRRCANGVIGLMLLALLGAPLSAAQKGEKGKRRGKRPRPAQVQVLNQWLKDIELSDEQKAKVDELRKEFAPKFAALRKEQNEILTPEQKKARRDALRKAKQEGKSFREAAKEIAKSMNLTDEQKEKMAEIAKKRKELTAELREKLLTILTDEQKAKLPKRGVRRGKKAAGPGAPGKKKGKGRRKKTES